MELRIADRQCRDQEGNLRRFHYFLTIDQEETPHFSCENYGVRVAESYGTGRRGGGLAVRRFSLTRRRAPFTFRRPAFPSAQPAAR